MRGMCGTDLRAYLGARGKRKVEGRLKVTEVRTLRSEVELVPFKAAFLACLALASGATKQKKKQVSTRVSMELGGRAE